MRSSWLDEYDRNIITDEPRLTMTMTGPRPPRPRYLAGLALAPVQAPTALIIVEQHRNQPEVRYAVRHVERLPLGMPYPSIAHHVQTVLQHPTLQRHTTLVVDATAVGMPVVDLLTQARLDPVAISVYGGDQVTHEGCHWHVPKTDVMAVLQILMQSERLKIAEGLPYAQILVQALLDCKVTIDPRTAHDAYAAWREDQRDDLFFGCALPLWWGEKGLQPLRIWW